MCFFFCGAWLRVGSARRRRERRLRCFLRHEQMAVPVALARATHHAVQRHQCTQTVTLAATDAATSAPLPVVEYIFSAPAVNHVAPAPVIDYVSSVPGIEYIAPAPGVTLSVPIQQLLPACTTTTDTTDLVYPQFSFPAVGAFSPPVVGSLPLDEFDALVYNRIRQEQIVARETTENTFENPVVQEQVVIQEIPQAPQVVDSFPLLGGVAARE